jgi:hypothetical protein
MILRLHLTQQPSLGYAENDYEGQTNTLTYPLFLVVNDEKTNTLAYFR